MSRSWPKERNTMLCDLIGRGYSFLQTALELSRYFGVFVSRNAVAGRANRLKLPTAQIKQANPSKPSSQEGSRD